MALLPLAAVQARLREELPPVEAWAERRGLPTSWDEAALTLRVEMVGPDQDAYLLEGDLEDYPTLPPSWRFLDPRDGERIGDAAYPRSAEPSPRGSPLIIGGGGEGVVICAHFNRLAYSQEGGIHGDWGPPANWQNQVGAYTYADTIADMLARIELEVVDSAGRRGELP